MSPMQKLLQEQRGEFEDIVKTLRDGEDVWRWEGVQYKKLGQQDILNWNTIAQQQLIDVIIELVRKVESIEPESSGRYNACSEIITTLQEAKNNI